jgi:hypothetical protein
VTKILSVLNPNFDPGSVQDLPLHIASYVMSSAEEPSDDVDEVIGLRYVSGSIPEYLCKFNEDEWEQDWMGDEMYVSFTSLKSYKNVFFNVPTGFKKLVHSLFYVSDYIKPYVRFQLLSWYPNLNFPQHIPESVFSDFSIEIGSNFNRRIQSCWDEIKKESLTSHGRIRLHKEISACEFEVLDRISDHT